MKKVISYSLYGDNKRYLYGALKNVILVNKYLPDWECRFYIGSDVPRDFLSVLSLMKNVAIYEIETTTNNLIKCSRFLVFSDPEVDIAVCRDVDARLSAREILAVQEWLESGLDFHVMKDHPKGHGLYEIYAGMFGAKAEKLRGMSQMLKMFISMLSKEEAKMYQIDQVFLAQQVFPVIKNSCLYHVENYECELHGDSVKKPFPSENRYPDNHIGAALDELDNYVYEIDIKAAMLKNKNKSYIYDFDLLESK